MACVLFLDLGTANIAPWWVTVLFVLLWLVLFAVARALVRAAPRRGCRGCPLVAFVVWLPVIVLGTRRLGWGG